MHDALKIPLVIENIFSCAFQTYENQGTGFSDPYCLREKYRVAGVCREWRNAVLSRINGDFHVYMVGSKIQPEEHYAPDEPLDSKHISDGPRFLTNLELIPSTAKPRRIVVYYEHPDNFKLEACAYLKTIGFDQRDWKSVQSLVINVGTAGQVMPPVEGIGIDVGYILHYTPNIESISLLVKGCRMLDIDALEYLPIFTANSITTLHLDTTNMCDLSSMVLPTLEELSIDCSCNADIGWLPPLDTGVIRRLRLKHIQTDEFFRLLQSTVAGAEVIFSQLEMLEVIFMAVDRSLYDGLNDGLVDVFGGSTAGDDGSSQYTYSFPKLRHLILCGLLDNVAETYRLFKDAPLETLRLTKNIGLLDYIDMGGFPTLRSIHADTEHVVSEASARLLDNRILGSRSSLDRVSIVFYAPLTLMPTQFGSTDIRILDLSYILTVPKLETLLLQLPHLVMLHIYFDLTETSGNPPSVEIADVLAAQDSTSRPSIKPLNTSLQLLAVDGYAASEFVLSAIGREGVAPLMPVIARTPSLLRMQYCCGAPGDDALLMDVLGDATARAKAPHFANVQVDKNCLRLMRQILKGNC
ncbi:hypothetical protein DL89DRAFT_55497 [Linderina pennispora]|uniref:F-box domain-containing protein n=1 Tax=Linderina pennispora TaxID=61395 RepID=A0A1Y1W177_9FUNG|nr:uncharacterized protein DL89DRAFT_55497 [Linderina pennispora]ORX67248.1 hypothetical protein DL89DRAFT_55497 [Linderina pennispora]